MTKKPHHEQHPRAYLAAAPIRPCAPRPVETFACRKGACGSRGGRCARGCVLERDRPAERARRLSTRSWCDLGVSAPRLTRRCDRGDCGSSDLGMQGGAYGRGRETLLTHHNGRWFAPCVPAYPVAGAWLAAGLYKVARVSRPCGFVRPAALFSMMFAGAPCPQDVSCASGIRRAEIRLSGHPQRRRRLQAMETKPNWPALSSPGIPLIGTGFARARGGALMDSVHDSGGVEASGRYPHRDRTKTGFPWGLEVGFRVSGSDGRSGGVGIFDATGTRSRNLPPAEYLVP